MHSMKKASKVEVEKTSASLSKAGPSKQPDPTMTLTSDPTTRASDHLDAQPMDTDVYRPPLHPKFKSSVQSHASKHSDLESDLHSEQPKRVCYKGKKHSDRKKHKVQAKYYSQSSSSEEDQSSVSIKKSTKPQQKAPCEPDHLQDSTDPVFYREKCVTSLHNLPRSSTTVLGLDNKKGKQDLRPRGPSVMLPLNPILKNTFEKFEQDFLASNLPEGKYIIPPA